MLGWPPAECGSKPLTGFYRDGCCNSGADDHGVHSVCTLMTREFLEFSRGRGNDLSTPMPEFGFPGLKAGDRWCLCAARWREALFATMSRNARDAADYFRVPTNRVIELGTQVEI